MMAELTIDNHGKVISRLSATTRLIGLGENTMPASFDEKVVGAKVGDVLDFEFEAKAEDGTSEYGDGELHAVVEVKSFRRRIVPAIDDELAAKVGCTNVEDMRKQLRHAINVQKNKELPGLRSIASSMRSSRVSTVKFPRITWTSSARTLDVSSCSRWRSKAPTSSNG